MENDDRNPTLALNHVEEGAQWYELGRKTMALVHMRRALAYDPDCAKAHLWLAVLLLENSEQADVSTHLLSAARFLPVNSAEHKLSSFLLAKHGETVPRSWLASHPNGKICFRTHYTNFKHRSGWPDASDALTELHNADGCLFESFLESPFIWEQAQDNHLIDALWRIVDGLGWSDLPPAEELAPVPFGEPWVGFLHNPPNMPHWFYPTHAPQVLFASSAWQESMPYCHGIFTLSEYAARWVRKQVNVPVSALVLPTLFPDDQFDWGRFIDNPDKKVVQIGWWLRQLSAIFHLQTPDHFQKVFLNPDFASDAAERLQSLRTRECAEFGWDVNDTDNTQSMDHLPDNEYDQLLSQNLVFLNLYDASANNAVVECIARGTPILVNRLPAVTEYLGTDYPLFYDDLDHARQMISDIGRIQAAHDYLRTCPTRAKLNVDHFRNSFIESEVYQSL